MTTQTPAEQIAAATSLEDLRDLFAALPDEDATDLPTFGGEAPAGGTSEVWSWDAERLLVGTCADDLRIVSRSEWRRPYPVDVAREVAARRPDLAAHDAIAAVLTADPTLTADEVIESLDEAAAEHAADLAHDAAQS